MYRIKTKKNKTKINNNKGITLIALVVTIIILILLAGVSISMLTGENGIITQVRNAEYKTELAAIKEKFDLALTNNIITGEKLKEYYKPYTSNLDNEEGTVKEIIKDADEKILETIEIREKIIYYVGNDERERKIAEELGYKIQPFEFSEENNNIIVTTKDFIGIDGVLTIPSYVEGIASNAFYGNPKITKVDFSQNKKITEIPANTFQNSSITEVVFSDSIKTIGSRAFSNCNNLTKFARILPPL